MKAIDLPPNAMAKWGHLPFLTKQTALEYSSACPVCGDSEHIGPGLPDRFRIMAPKNTGENWRGFCRRCRHFEFVDQGEEYNPDPAEIAKQKQERKRLQDEEARRIHKKISELQQAAYWRGYHDAMTEGQRELWHKQGVIDYFVDYYSLGFNPDYTYRHRGRTFHSPTMTIPHYECGFKPVNLQHRLLMPEKGVGKYRQTQGLPTAMFKTEPDEPLKGAVLVVEGAKKGIVVYTHLGMYPLGFPLLTIAVPSKMPGSHILEKLSDCEPIYLMLDHDAYEGEDPAARRVAQKLGMDRVRFVNPGNGFKPDDFLIEGGSADEMRRMLRRAKKFSW